MRASWTLVALLLAGSAQARDGGTPGKGRGPVKADLTDPAYLEQFIPPGGFDAGPVLPPQLPFVWDLANVESTVDVPDVIMADGIPVKLRQVLVKGKLDAVMREVEEMFFRQNLYVQPADLQYPLTAHRQLTGLDPTRFISYSVIAQQVTGELCSLVLGEANVGLGVAAGTAAANAENFAPLFPGASGVVRTKQESLRTINYVAPGTEGEVKAFYAEVLKRAGYQQLEPGSYQRASEELNVLVRARNGITSVLLSSKAAAPKEAP